jgi:hypothetical protein
MRLRREFKLQLGHTLFGSLDPFAPDTSPGC